MSHAAPETPHPSDRLVHIGVAVFALGLVALLLIVVPFFLGRSNAPLGLALGTLLLPIGLAIALWGLLRSARRARH